MAQLTATQTVVQSDFNGSAGAGLFLFDDLQNISRPDGLIHCDQLGIFAPNGVALDWVIAYFVPPIGDLGAAILIGAISGAFLATPDGSKAVKFCPGIVPRSEVGFYRLQLFSSGIDGQVRATLAYRTEGVA